MSTVIERLLQSRQQNILRGMRSKQVNEEEPKLKKEIGEKKNIDFYVNFVASMMDSLRHMKYIQCSLPRVTLQQDANTVFKLENQFYH